MKPIAAALIRNMTTNERRPSIPLPALAGSSWDDAGLRNAATSALPKLPMKAAAQASVNEGVKRQVSFVAKRMKTAPRAEQTINPMNRVMRYIGSNQL